MRLDKWLWVARFFRSRGLAHEAVEGGRVRVGGERAKPSKAVNVGDRVEVIAGPSRREVIVAKLSERRGPAREAREHYEETEESRLRHERAVMERRFAIEPARSLRGRPTKKDRRALDRLRSGD